VEILRTPDERFVDLPGWPFEPRYTDVDALVGSAGSDAAHTIRVHHIDVSAGVSDAPIVMLFHGEPTWGYLYRHMVSVLVEHGYRVIVPDLVGFGRSDKPASVEDYSYNRMVEWMLRWFDQLGLETGDVTFFGQDWGGLIGLRIVTARPDMFSRIVVSNTGLPTGDRPPTEAFLEWQRFSKTLDEFPVGALVKRGTPVSEAEVAAYDAPFPEERFKAAARIMPSLVPTSPTDPAAAANRVAWDVLGSWTKPLLTAFSDSDPVTAGGERVFQKQVPGAAGQRHVTIVGAGHFVQETHGPELAGVIHEFIVASPFP
jgi:haloalkane dehalogenase